MTRILAAGLRCCRISRTRYSPSYHYYPSYWGDPVSSRHIGLSLVILAGILVVLAAVRLLRGLRGR